MGEFVEGGVGFLCSAYVSEIGKSTRGSTAERSPQSRKHCLVSGRTFQRFDLGIKVVPIARQPAEELHCARVPAW